MVVARLGLQRGLLSRSVDLSIGAGHGRIVLFLAVDVNAMGDLIRPIGHGLDAGAGPDFCPGARRCELGNFGRVSGFLSRIVPQSEDNWRTGPGNFDQAFKTLWRRMIGSDRANALYRSHADVW